MTRRNFHVTTSQLPPPSQQIIVDAANHNLILQACTLDTMRRIVWHSLDWNLLGNALFFSERMVSHTMVAHTASDNADMDAASVANTGVMTTEMTQYEESLYMLATCHMRQGKWKVAFELLKHTRGVLCRYLFAQSCVKLSKFIEAEDSIQRILADEKFLLPAGSSTVYLGTWFEITKTNVYCFFLSLVNKVDR